MVSRRRVALGYGRVGWPAQTGEGPGQPLGSEPHRLGIQTARAHQDQLVIANNIKGRGGIIIVVIIGIVIVVIVVVVGVVGVVIYVCLMVWIGVGHA